MFLVDHISPFSFLFFGWQWLATGGAERLHRGVTGVEVNENP